MLLKEFMPAIQDVFLEEAKKHNKPYKKRELLNKNPYELFVFSDTTQGHEYWSLLCWMSLEIKSKIFK